MATDSIETFWSFVGSAGLCMMTTRDAGVLRSRPMRPQIDHGTKEFRFLTRLSTHKIEELAENPEVNLAFADQRSGHFVSVSGQAYLTQDKKLIEQLWSLEAETPSDRGKADQDSAVIRVVPSEAEYWDAKSTLLQAWNVFKAKQTQASLGAGENRKIALR